MLVENLLNLSFSVCKEAQTKSLFALILFTDDVWKNSREPFLHKRVGERVSTAMRASTRRLVRNLGDPLACEMRVVGVAASPALLLVRNCTKTASGLLANNCCSSSSKTREMY